jgi:Uma2 family endonuclease
VNGRVRYPDAVVTCTPVARDADIVPDPVVVFEVLSSSTAGTDRIAKNEDYRATDSIRRYVMLEQSSIAATVFAREGSNWVGHLLTGDAVLALPEIGAELPLAELYAGVEPDGT